MKYIVVKDSVYTNTEKIFVFPDSEMHSEFYSSIKGEYNTFLISAGFVGFDDEGKIYCYGNSISLNKYSRKEDTVLLKRELSKRN